MKQWAGSREIDWREVFWNKVLWRLCWTKNRELAWRTTTHWYRSARYESCHSLLFYWLFKCCTRVFASVVSREAKIKNGLKPLACCYRHYKLNAKPISDSCVKPHQWSLMLLQSSTKAILPRDNNRVAQTTLKKYTCDVLFRSIWPSDQIMLIIEKGLPTQWHH